MTRRKARDPGLTSGTGGVAVGRDITGSVTINMTTTQPIVPQGSTMPTPSPGFPSPTTSEFFGAQAIPRQDTSRGTLWVGLWVIAVVVSLLVSLLAWMTVKEHATSDPGLGAHSSAVPVTAASPTTVSTTATAPTSTTPTTTQAPVPTVEQLQEMMLTSTDVPMGWMEDYEFTNALVFLFGTSGTSSTPTCTAAWSRWGDELPTGHASAQYNPIDKSGLATTSALAYNTNNDAENVYNKMTNVLSRCSSIRKTNGGQDVAFRCLIHKVEGRSA